jgi:HSP20 family protein
MLRMDFDRFGFPDPWKEFDRMRRELSRHAFGETGEFPPVNVWLKGDEALVTTEIPGVEPGSIEVSVMDGTLTLRGTRRPEGLSEGESYHRRERWYGDFSRAVRLPFRVEAPKVEAHYSKGVLSVKLPRAEAEKPKKVAIKAA